MTLATLSSVTVTETSIHPVDALDNRLYGTDAASGNMLYVSDDLGDNWTLVQNLGTGSGINGIRKMSDGEVLVLRRADGLYKSSGWATDPTDASFSQVLTPSADAYVLPWGVDVSDGIVIATEYAADPRDPSRYVWVSTDSGDTFTAKLDLTVLYPSQDSAVHWHAVCIDPWSNNRLWAAHGDGLHGMYYSDDLGDNWTLLTPDWQPTAMGATPHGIVLGTDELEEGLLRVLRTSDPADMRVEGMAALNISGWYGFAQRAWRDPVTNLIYVPWQVDTDGLPAHIMVSDGRTGHSIYQTVTTTTPNMRHVFVLNGTLVASLLEDDTYYLVRGTLAT